ncbi:pyridoxamine 5'-phosphate oxidase family protein [Granulosicoccus sp.]|nr:pyridoxamine 5'-phosphate oxidase family protein [Granulosicoccus sp.]MDB4222364.1 pyridoxamine 5'-phosphate oxidase family protein [Granulosicoccus sp.]
MDNYADILFIDEVRALQERDGTAEKYQLYYPQRTKETLDESDQAFIESRESFYISSVSSTGWPYVQHRGGPKGFLKVIGDNQLGFIDYPGNRQFITMGHAAHDNRVALFLMDYERRARMKLLGRLTMQHAKDADPDLCEQLSISGQAKIERIATIDVVAIDWNCPKYIPQWYTEETVNTVLEAKLNPLIEENELLKAKLAEYES